MVRQNSSAQKTRSLNAIVTTIATMRIRWYLLTILIIATVVRLISITKASIWHDEGYTAMLVQHDSLDIIARTMRDVHPPLYYLLTHYWQLLFGDSELALRGFSLLCGVATVAAMYFVMRLLFSERTARLAGLFVALGPFAVRYSEEARMYGLASLLVVVSTYLLLRGLTATKTRPQTKYWIGYGLVIAAGLYTHYYVALIIPVHIGYAFYKSGGLLPLLRRRDWWIGNFIGAGLFIPWLPVLLSQVSRVQAGFWIPKVTIETLPDTLMQFIVFSSSIASVSVRMAIAVGLIALVVYVVKKATLRDRKGLIFLSAWIFVPMLLAVVFSLKQPVYVDRYFVFSSIAFYGLLAAMLSTQRWSRPTYIVSIAMVCLIFIGGIFSVGIQANHKMRQAGEYVSSHYQAGDTLVSAELYTYFDFSYYNHTNAPVLLLSHDPMSGYGETSLLYDQPTTRLENFNDLSTQHIAHTNRVWVIGKTGQKDYFTTEIPSTWKQLDQFETGDIAVHLYQL